MLFTVPFRGAGSKEAGSTEAQPLVFQVALFMGNHARQRKSVHQARAEAGKEVRSDVVPAVQGIIGSKFHSSTYHQVHQ